MPFVRSSDGITIGFDVQGDAGAPIVFVHGWSCDRSYWRNQMPWFGRRHRAVAIDLAGHGESGSGRADWTMAAFGEDVAAVVEALDLAGVILVGHSMGGDVIVEAARRLGDRVRALVWVDTYGALGQPIGREEVDQFAAPFRADFVPAARAFVRRLFRAPADPGLVELVVNDMSSAPPEIAIPALEHAFGNEPAVLAALPALTVPIVAINPADGHTHAASLSAYGVTTVLMPGVGHFPMLEAPDAFNELLERTIDRFSYSGEAT